MEIFLEEEGESTKGPVKKRLPPLQSTPVPSHQFFVSYLQFVIAVFFPYLQLFPSFHLVAFTNSEAVKTYNQGPKSKAFSFNEQEIRRKKKILQRL